MISDHLISQLADAELNACFDTSNFIKAQKCDDKFSIVEAIIKINYRGMNKINAWVEVITFIRSWEEKSNKLLHKGTPYHFFALSCLEIHDFEKAVIGFYQAFLEDYRNVASSSYNLPAYHFLSLKSNSTVFANEINEAFNEFILPRVEKHNEILGNISVEDFRKKFLDKKGITFQKTKSIFTLSIWKIWALRRIHKTRIFNSSVSDIILMNSILNIIQVIEIIAKKKLGLRKDATLGTVYKELERRNAWKKVPEVNHMCWDTFINKTLRNKNGVFVGNVYLSKNNINTYEQFCFVFIWKLRNDAAHNLAEIKKIWNKNFTEVFQFAFSALIEIINI